MYIRRERGSVLILMLVVVALLLILGISLLMLNTGTHKLEILSDTTSRTNYMAESGIKRILPEIDFNSQDYNLIKEDLDRLENQTKNNPITISSSDGTINCVVTVIRGKYNPNNPYNPEDSTNPNKFSIKSMATYTPKKTKSNMSSLNSTNVRLLADNVQDSSSLDTTGQVKKTVVALIEIKENDDGETTPPEDSQDDIPSINPLTESCLNIYGNVNNSYNDFSVGNGNNTNLNIKGSAYIQAYSSKFASNLNITNGNLISLNKSKIDFNNNSSNASISGKIFLQSNDDIKLSQNINAGTIDNPSGYTILSDKTINFDNNSTTSNIYGDAYVDAKNGVTMSQTLNVNKGNLNIISNSGDINLSGNSNPTKVSGWAYLSGNNITIARNTTIGTESSQLGFEINANKYINLDKNSTTTTVFGDTYLKGTTGITLGQNINVNKNFTAITNGGIDLGNTNKSISGNSYIKSNYVDGNTDQTGKNGIYNASTMNVAGYSALLSSNTINNDSGSKDNINGNLYIEAEKDLSMTNQLDKVGGLYSVVSNNGNITFKNDIKNILGTTYAKAKGDINVNSSVHDIRTNNDFTMIASNITVPWINFYLNGNSFIKALTKIHIDTNNNNFGNSYIETNNFEHNNIKASSLETFVPNINSNNVSPNNFTRLTSPKEEPSKPTVPSEPAEIQIPSKSASKKEIPNILSMVKNGVQYNHWYTSYSGIQYVIAKGSNNNDVVNAINYSQNSNYKVIIIDGNCTLGNSDWSKINKVNGDNISINNTIIYCTGKLVIDNPGKIINFNYSTIFSNGFNFNYNTINMSAINQSGNTIPFTKDMETYINEILTNNIDNYVSITRLPIEKNSDEDSGNNGSNAGSGSNNNSENEPNYTISYEYY